MMYVLEPEQESDLWLVRLAEFYVRLDKPAFQTEIEQIVFGATGIPCTVEPSMIMSHPPAHVHVDKLQKDGLAAIRRVAMVCVPGQCSWTRRRESSHRSTSAR